MLPIKYWFRRKARSGWSQKDIKGMIAEFQCATDLRNFGYKVAKMSHYSEDKERLIPNKKAIANVLHSHPQKSEIMHIIANGYVGDPDLIVRKDNRIFFVEVKSGSSKVSKIQKSTMNFYNSHGFDCYTVRYDVNYSCCKSTTLAMIPEEDTTLAHFC